MYYDARYYDPDLGRFLQADPFLAGLNRYTYCGNNPIRYSDPSGNYPVDEVGEGVVYDEKNDRYLDSDGSKIEDADKETITEVVIDKKVEKVVQTNTEVLDNTSSREYIRSTISDLMYNSVPEATRESLVNGTITFTSYALAAGILSWSAGVFIEAGAAQIVNLAKIVTGWFIQNPNSANEALPNSIVDTFRSGTYAKVVSDGNIILCRNY